MTNSIDQLPKPEFTAGHVAYEREIQLALDKDSRKRENYKKYLASTRRCAKVDYLPVRLDIEYVSRCNFRCNICVVSTWDNMRRAQDMSLGKFRTLIDEQYGLLEIKLNGLGEVLLAGDDYFEAIKYARSKHIWVRMVTNGSLLHLRDNYRKLVDAGPNEIQMSVDGHNKESFESIRKGSNFERVIKNMKLLNEYTIDKGIRVTKMWTVVQKNNVEYLEKIVDLAADLKFPDLVFSLEPHGWALEEWQGKNMALNARNALTYGRLANLVPRGESKGVRVRFWSILSKFNTESLENLCPWPFERALISSDSRVVPCCQIANPDTFELGGGSGKSLVEMWNSSEYQEFRKSHLLGHIPKVCKGCYTTK